MWNKLLGISKSILDLKSAIATAKELAGSLKDFGTKMQALDPINSDLVSCVKKLSAVKDCRSLLAASADDSLGQEGVNAREALKEAWESFEPLIPERDPAFVSFKEFMDAQWLPNQDGKDIQKGEVSFLLSMQEPSRAFAEIGAACYAGRVRKVCCYDHADASNNTISYESFIHGSCQKTPTGPFQTW